jgi:hypothetical protein
VILRNNNYALWRNIAQLAIASANAWDIIAGNEARPANPIAAKEWDTQSANAIRIINMLINQSYLLDLIPFAIIKDVEGA